MDEKNQNSDRDSGQPSRGSPAEETESIYKGLKNVPLKVVDLIIVLCIAALVIVIAVGVLNR